MIRVFTKGLARENPVFVFLLGLCPALAISTKVINALGMGVAVLFVLIGSNLAASLLGKYIPGKVRLSAHIVVIATLVSFADMFMQAYTPGLSRSLGIFVPLITVNCIILGRVVGFAHDNTPAASVLDALGMGLGFLFALTCIALVREVLGAGTITLFPLGGFSGVVRIPGLSRSPVGVFGLSAGAFLVMGYLKALFDVISRRAMRSRNEDAV